MQIMMAKRNNARGQIVLQIKSSYVGLPFLILCALFFTACLPKKEFSGKQTIAPDSNVVSDPHNYTFAVYNNENLLITTPVEEWEHHSKAGSVSNVKCGDGYEVNRFTDLYIVSHGWNYTTPEATSNYHKYIEAMKANILDEDGFLRGRKCVRPYFMFVAWASVSRPLSDVSRSILPYKFDDAIQPLVSKVDMAVFQLLSGWKESLNAFQNALGRDKVPSDYWKRSYENITYKPRDTLFEAGWKSAGRNLPMSAVIYEILRRNKDEEINQRIHLVGHSYGAKLISLAAIEALHRYYYSGTSRCPDKEFQKIEPQIDSLVLLNGAFNPRELVYDWRLFAEAMGCYSAEEEVVVDYDKVAKLLQGVDKKALIYSNSDTAAGFLYELGQVILNGSISQDRTSAFSKIKSLTQERFCDEKIGGDDSECNWLYYVMDTAGGMINAPIALGVDIARSALISALKTISNLPTRLWNSVRFGNFLNPVKWLNDDVAEQGITRMPFSSVGRADFKVLFEDQVERHFVKEFYPVKKLRDMGQSKSAECFAVLACSANQVEKDILACSEGQVEKYVKPEYVYSYNASSIYNSIGFLGGSHGDLGELEIAEGCSEYNSDKVYKISATFNFILNFTLPEDTIPQSQPVAAGAAP